MKIAVVGGGVSGLACAFWLGNRHDVTLYEAAPQLGGNANTVEVAVDGRSHAVDTGFIVYNECTYPEFTRLLEVLHVPTQAADMSFGLSCERSGVEWSSRGLGGVFASPANAFRPAFVRMLREILRFAREAPALLARRDEKVTLRDYLLGGGSSDGFRDCYVVPMKADENGLAHSLANLQGQKQPGQTGGRYLDGSGYQHRSSDLEKIGEGKFQADGEE